MIMRFYKKVDCRNSVLIPKRVVEQFGEEYYMEIYEDKIVLVPIKPKKEEK